MAGGVGLKPIVKLVCPIADCAFKFKYHVRDSRMHPDLWVMTKESREHLATGHAEDKPKLYIVKSEELPAAA
jgi:hypothetical protein